MSDQRTIFLAKLVDTMSLGVIIPKIYPASDSTTAFQFMKADNTTSVMCVDTTNSRVGIGTTVPAYKLDVNGNANFNGNIYTCIDDATLVLDGDPATSVEMVFTSPRHTLANLGLIQTTSNYGLDIQNKNSVDGVIESRISLTGISDPSAFKAIRFFTNNNQERMRIDSTGNIGIGTTNPSMPIHIKATNGGPAATVRLEKYDATYYADLSIDTNSNFSITNNNSRTLLYGSWGGNIGIGTTSPDNLLHVYKGASGATPYVAAYLIVENNDVASINIITPDNKESGIFFGNVTSNVDGGVVYNNTLNSRGLQFRTGGNTIGMVITSDQKVGIGTTNPATFKLEVAGHIGPSADSTYNLGSDSVRFANVYADNLYGTITPTGFTQGSVIFAGSGGILSQHNDAFFWDNSNERLGIGTTSPAYKLDILSTTASDRGINVAVTGTGSPYGGVFSVTGAGTSNIAIYADARNATNNFGIYSAYGVNYFSGNVGIGTTNPLKKLQVNGTIYSNGGTTETLSDTGDFLGSVGYWQLRTGTNYRFALDSYNNSNAWQESLTVLRSGNVGIGTTNPQATLETRGKIRIAVAPDVNALEFYDATNSALRGIFYMSGTDVRYHDGAADSVTFKYGGNIGIGTTNPGLTGYNRALTISANIDGLVSALELQSKQTTDADLSGIEFLNDTNRVASIVAKRVGANNSAELKFYTNNAGSFAQRMVIDKSGNVGIGTTNPAEKLQIVGGRLRLPQTDEATTPTLNFGDGDSGFYERSDDQIAVALGGTWKWTFDPSWFGYPGINYPLMISSAATATTPVFTLYGDMDTGIGRADADILSLIAGGTNVMNITNGNVGIGTTVPSYAKLCIQASEGNSAIGLAGYSVLKWDNSNYLHYGGFNASEWLRLCFHTSGAERVRIDDSGNVGIGTTNPTNKLSIDAGLNTKAITIYGGLNEGQYGAIGFQYSADLPEYARSEIRSYTGVSGFSANMAFWLNDGGNNLLERMRIVGASGNVGIGTTNPATFKLEVAGHIGPSADSTYNLGSDSVRFANIYADNLYGTITPTGFTQGSVIFAGSGGILSQHNDALFWDNSNERLGIGTTVPATKLTICGSVSANYEAAVFGTSDWTTSIGSALVIRQGAGTGNTYSELIAVQSGWAANANLVLNSSGGNVGIGTTNPATFKLEVAGHIGPSADSTYNLGSDSVRFANIYADNLYGTITPTGFTQGSVIFAGSGGILSQHNANLFWDDTNNRLGIGTTIPKAKLHTSLSASGFPPMIYIGGAIYPRALHNISASISTDDGSESTGRVVGINLENSSATDNMMSPMITFSRMAPASEYNPIFAAIGGFNTGQGTNDDWVKGDLIFFTVSGHALTERVRIDSAGNVGIGTTNPLSKLHVSGGQTYLVYDHISTPALDVRNSGGGAVAIFGIGGGNVGIGTTNPSQKLHIYGTSAPTIQIASPTGVGYIGIATSAGELSNLASTNDFCVRSDTNNLILTARNNSGNIYLGTGGSGTESSKITILNGGNIGIGTTVPGSLLTVQGDSKEIKLRSADYDLWMVSNTGSGASLDKAYMELYDTGVATIRLRSDSYSWFNGGNVGIGTTSPDNLFHIYKGASGQAPYAASYFIIENNDAASINILTPDANESAIFFGNVTSNVDGGIIYNNSSVSRGLSFRTGGNTIGMVITSDQKVGIGTTNPATFKLEVAGHIGPSADSTYNLGSDSVRFANIYADNLYGTITPTGFTQGSVIFAGSGGILSQHNDALFWDNSNERLGIGTTVPAYKLDINYGGEQILSLAGQTTGAQYITITNTAGASYFGIESSTGGRILPLGIAYATALAVPSGKAIQMGDATAVAMTILNKNIGIGTTNPVSKLDILSTVASDRGINVAVTGTGSPYGGVFSVTGAGTSNIAIYADARNATNNFGIYSYAGVNYFSGNVGIGTTVPGAKLQILGAESVPGGAGVSEGILTITSDITDNIELAIGMSSAVSRPVWLQSRHGSPSFPNNYYVLSLNPLGGNVGIGTTVPGTILDVNTGNAADCGIRGTGAWPSFQLYCTLVDDNARNWALLANNQAYGDFQIQTSQAKGGNPLTSYYVRLYIDNSGNVGIGTTIPLYPLDIVAASGSACIKSTTGTNYADLEFINTGGTGAIGLNNSAGGSFGSGGLAYAMALYHSAKAIQFFPGGAARVTIDTSGNVGIGTTVPGAKLDIAAASSGVPALQIGSNNDYEIKFVGNQIANIYQSYSGNALYINTNGGILNLGSSTDASHLVINTGNVGIGTTSPDKLFHVYAGASGQSPYAGSSAIIESNGAAALNLLTPDAEESAIFFGNVTSNVDGGIIYNNSGTARGLQFRTGGNTTGMVITSDQKVGIGTTGPQTQLHLHKTSGHAVVRITTDSTSYDTGIQFGPTTTTVDFNIGEDTGTGFFSLSPGGTFGASGLGITTGGNVGIGLTNPTDPLMFAGSVGRKIGLYYGTGYGFGIQSALFEIISHDANADFTFGYGTSGSLTRLVTIKGSGKVGVGTTAPNNAIHTTGAVEVNGAGTSPASTGLLLSCEASYDRIQSFNSRALYINPLGNNTILNSGGGNVGIGTTSPNTLLDVAGKVKGCRQTKTVTTTPVTLTAAEIPNMVVFVGTGASVINLPAGATAGDGATITFRAKNAVSFSIDPNGTEIMDLAGTELAGGYCIVSDALSGSHITLIWDNTSGAWRSLDMSGVWTSGG